MTKLGHRSELARVDEGHATGFDKLTQLMKPPSHPQPQTGSAQVRKMGYANVSFDELLYNGI